MSSYNFNIMKNVELKIVATDEEYAQAMNVRRQVFVEEHSIPEHLEYDGNDHSSTHVLALDEGKPIGTMRIRYFNGFVKLERMCVLPKYRKTDVSEQIMRKGMLFAAEKGYDKAYGVCKKQLLNRWRRDGFVPIPNVPPVEQNGMTLIPVCCPLPVVENPITMQSPAEVLNAREGDWSQACKQLPAEKIKTDFEKFLRRAHSILRPQQVKIDAEKIRYIRNMRSQDR